MGNWFITGVSTGLGRALSRAVLDAGHTVVGTVRDENARVQFEGLSPGNAIGLLLDVTDPAAVSDAVQAAEVRTGGLDFIVNNAGLGYTGAIEETSLADAKALFDVNVWGPFAVIQAALPYLRARGRGHIINIGSISGMASWHGTGIYGASKFALDCLGRTLAQEVNPLGIAVTNVAPGGMRTEFAATRLLGAKPEIADYAATAHIARQVLTDHHTQEPSDPDLIAKAIVTAVTSEQPPLVLLLGRDAQKYAKAEFEMLSHQFETWKHLTTAVDAD